MTTTDTDDLIEAVARGQRAAGLQWLAAQGDDGLGWADVPDEVFASSAVAAVRRYDAEHGLVTVPKEPSHGMVRAATESRARDDEGEFLSLSDLIDFSGENKTYTVVRQALRDAMATSPLPPGAEENDQ